MKIFLSVILCLSTFAAQAQHTLTGRVVKDSDGSPFPYATITLMSADSVDVSGQISDVEGRFVMDDVPAGSYTVSVSFVGYETIIRPVEIPAGAALGEFRMVEAVNQISAVTVVGRRPFVEQQADRYVVNVSNNISTVGRNAIDVLANTPGVLVRDGAVSVMAKDVTIYIDGRPSGLSGEQLGSLLASIQGDNINRIEVITNPSSRYDAAGTGGIIDIRTKKGLRYGLNGSLDAGYRQGRRNAQNAGFTLNWRRKAFNLFGNYSVNRSNNWVKLGQHNGTRGADEIQHLFDQSVIKESDKAKIGQTYRIGADYYINDKNIVGLLYNGYRTGNELAIQNSVTTISPALDGVASSRMRSSSTADNSGDQFNLNYQGMFAKPGQQLNVDFDYGHFLATPWQQNRVDYFDAAGLAITDAEEYLRHINTQDIEVWSAKADFSTPVWKNAKMDIGAKSAGATTDNDLVYEQQVGGSWNVDTDRTNNFVYSETIHAGYVSVNQNLGKVNIQVGLRGEHTYVDGDQRTTSEVNKKEWFDLFPTLYVSYGLSQNHQFGMSYGRRILRPNYGQLNPFEIKIDAYSFERGNPDLKPSYINNVSLSYTYGQSLMVRLSFDNRRDVITQLPVEEEGRYGLTRANYGENNAFAAMVNYRAQPFKWWNVNTMVMGRYSRDYSREDFGTIDERSFGVMAQLANSFTITRTLSAELTGLYQSRIQEAYLALRPMGNLSLGVRKSFLAGKLSVSLSANDLLGTYRTRAESVSDAIVYRLDIRRDTRFVNLGVRWNFGTGNAKAARNRTSGIEDEKKRAQ